MIGLIAGAALAAQIIWLTWPGLQGVVAAFAIAALAQQLWEYRTALNPHVDMLILMNSFGGLAMITQSPVCHSSVESFVSMSAGMLLLGIPPMILWSRCMQQARESGILGQTLMCDTAGMLAGMGVAHWMCQGAEPLISHTAMLLGMNTGMIAARGMYALVRGSHNTGWAPQRAPNPLEKDAGKITPRPAPG